MNTTIPRLYKVIRPLMAGMAFLFSALLPAQTFEKGFDELYEKKVGFLSEAGKTVYNGVVQPIWKGSDSFLFSTSTLDSVKVFEVDLQNKTIKETIQSELDELRKNLRGGYYDPSDESMYARGEKRPVKSPDGKLEAVFRDNNIWIREAGSKESGRQISFDGTDQDKYDRVLWSPDSKKLAAFRKEVIKERQILLRNSRPADQVQPEYKWLD